MTITGPHELRLTAMLTSLAVVVTSLGLSCTDKSGPTESAPHGHNDGPNAEIADSGAGAGSASPTSSQVPRQDAGPPGGSTSPPSTEPPPAPTGVEPPPKPEVPCKLEFSVETAAYGGKYNNSNAGAIWITDAAGVGVRALESWSRRNQRSLYHWNYARQGLDIVSGASHRAYGVHQVSWDCTFANGELVPFGKYIVHVEHAASNTDTPYFSVAFEHTGATPIEETVAPLRGFNGATLKYHPGNAAMGAPPGEKCTETSLNVLDWCENSTSCPGAFEQVSCREVGMGGVDCSCSSTTGLQRKRLSGVPIQDACASASEQCRISPPAGPLVQCVFQQPVSSPPETPDACALEKKCTDTTLGGSWVRSTVDCQRDGTGWRCDCRSSERGHSFFFNVEGATPPCSVVADVCDEPPTFNGPSVCEPPSSSVVGETCQTFEECIQQGVTSSGRVVFQSRWARNAVCTQTAVGSDAWSCSCNSGAPTTVSGQDGGAVCAQSFASCSPI